MTAEQQYGTSRLAEPPASDGPAYSGVSSRAVGYVPGFLRAFIVEAGGMAGLGAKLIWSAVRYPRGYWTAVLDDMYRTARDAWFPVFVAIFGFLVALSLLVVQFFAIVGGQQLFGPYLLMYSSRSFTVWVSGVVVAGVIGAKLTTDIGTRKVREELDAMEVMGIDPVRDIGVPRVVSLTLITMLLSIPSVLMTVVSMQFGAAFVTGISAADFYHNLFNNVVALDFIAVIVNHLVVGILIGVVCSYKGFSAAGGAIGLGRAVNQAVVISLLGIFVLQLAFQALYLGFFPELGAAK